MMFQERVFKRSVLAISSLFIIITCFLLVPLEIEKPKVGMPFQTTFMIQRNPLNPSVSQWQDLRMISPMLVCAVVKAEDREFFIHHGFDFSSVFSSIYSNLTKETRYGASTITQQLAKNLYGSIERTFLGKIREYWYALRLELNFSKEEIIELYLNSIELGNGIWGVENASEYYFHKSSGELSVVDSIVLASFIAAPLQIENDSQKDRMSAVYRRVNYQLLTSEYYEINAYENLKRIGMNFTQFPPHSIQELIAEYPHEIKENSFSSYLEDGCGIEREIRNEKK